MAYKRETGLCLKLNEKEMDMLRTVSDYDGLTKSAWLRLQIVLNYKAITEE